MSIEIYIQARMSSTRLPGKVLKHVLGRPLLSFQWERLKKVKNAQACVLLTTIHHVDYAIVDFCQKENIPFIRGSEDDVLGRYYQAAQERKPEAIVRITADCPLIDPAIIDRVIEQYKKENPKLDYVSNTLERTYPRGMEVEVFSFEALEKAFKKAGSIAEREHVTLFMYRHPEQFTLKNVASEKEWPPYRLTVDTADDFALIKLLLENLYPKKKDFSLEDIANLLKQHPEWSKINAHVAQKNP